MLIAAKKVSWIMNHGFVQVDLEQMSFMAYQPWLRRGWLHGFTGISADFSSVGLSTWVPKLLSSFNIENLWLVRQEHSDVVVDLDAASQKSRERLKPLSLTNFDIELALVGDAMIIRAAESNRVAIGVRTADCVPLLVRYGSYCAAIHAGWRGLASKIITKSIDALVAKQRSDGPADRMDILLGPCAGPQSYEVGPEVIEFLGSGAVYSTGNSGRYLLDLVGTARAEIGNVLQSAQTRVGLSSICTISDSSYHSYRRSQGISGSNLSFLIC